jgi:hypothetical protein
LKGGKSQKKQNNSAFAFDFYLVLWYNKVYKDKGDEHMKKIVERINKANSGGGLFHDSRHDMMLTHLEKL